MTGRPWGRTAAVLAALMALAAAGWTFSKSTTTQLYGGLVDRVDTQTAFVALTLDDGPTAQFTPEVLDILKARSAVATFYLIGREAEENPEAIAAITEDGHEIGNHSWSHDRLILKTPAAIRAEITRTETALRSAGYDGPLTFRPPYGQKLLILPGVLASMGLTTVMWDVGLEAEGDSAEAYAARIVEAARPGSIIGMHVMYRSRAVDRAALPLVIDGLRAKGLTLVTVSDLLAEG